MKRGLLLWAFLGLWLVSGQDGCSNRGCVAYDSKKGCQCDSSCTSRRDCCSDYQSICLSCAEVGCQTDNPNRGCQCNKDCMYSIFYISACGTNKKRNESFSICIYEYATCIKGKNLVECATVPSSPQDRRTDKSKLRMVEYNMEWLFTNYSHSMGSMICPGECEWTNNSVAKEHLEELAQYIATLDADIIVAVEVSDCWILSELISQMGSAGKAYRPYLKFGIDTSTGNCVDMSPFFFIHINVYLLYVVTGQNVGLLTKIDPVEDLTRSSQMNSYPISGSKCGYQTSSSPTTSCSKHFRTRFQIDSLNGQSFFLTLFGLHFIAYPTTADRCAKREAQAWIIRNYASQAIANGDQIIVIGDFNDFDDQNIGADSATPTSQVFKILREMTSPNLQNVNGWIPQTQRYSNWYDKNSNCKDDGDKEHSLIDHILVSNDLFSSLTNVQALHEYPGVCGSLYSDHYPIVADFDLDAMISDNWIQDFTLSNQ
ncbi:hypothetical protein RFI_29612 [Reticulomyxa filosa]|uniref:SMB domain-containing protein n=1 Tax=Reticulomyxa filosa TaxID=46433 RepID=X6M425_RETFI|nr:hypothetical protein RFI_29612 [Reticulomyxa filosa]|eukprot:ETO07780.1 hypothetical protein RFI_29612 [Reticulomyxa filosa]